MTDPALLVAQQENLECTLPKGALLKPKGAAPSFNPKELPKLKPKGAAQAQT